MPETYAVLPSAAIVMPPSVPGMGMICTSFPTGWIVRVWHTVRRFPLSLRILQVRRVRAWTRTMRMSLRPRPEERVQRKRPLVVSAGPPGQARDPGGACGR